MALTPINNGVTPNDGTGQTLRDAFSTVNTNYIEIQNLLNGKSNVGHTHPISDIIGLQDALDTLTNSIEDVELSLSGYAGTDVYTMIEEINESITTINDTINDQNATIAELIDQVEALDSQLDAINTSIANLQYSQGLQDAAILALQNSHTAQDITISGITSDIASIEADIEGIQEMDADQNAAIAEINLTLAQLNSEIGAIEELSGTVATHTTQIADLQDEIDNLVIPTLTSDLINDGEDGTSAYVTFADLDLSADRIVTSTGLVQSGMTLTLNAGWEWIISQNNYTNPSNVNINIPLASSGNTRIDLIVAGTGNTFTRIAGTQDATNPVAPDVPNGTLQATLVFVTDAEVIADTPIDGGEFQKKIEKTDLIAGSGPNNTVVVQGLAGERSSIRYTYGVNGVRTIAIADQANVYPGKILTIKNSQTSLNRDITLYHLSSTGSGGYKFSFPNQQDFILKPREIVQFSLRILTPTTGVYEYVGKMQEEVETPSLQDVIDVNELADKIKVGKLGFPEIVSSPTLYVSVPSNDGGAIFASASSVINGIQRYGVIKVNPDGSLDETFSSPIPNGDYSNRIGYIANVPTGYFISKGYNGGLTKSMLLNFDGTVNNSFDFDETTNYVVCVPSPSGKYYVLMNTGTFYDGVQIEDDSQPGVFGRQVVVRLNANGTLDLTFASRIMSTNYGYGLAVSNDAVYVGNYSRIFKLDLDGEINTGFTHTDVYSQIFGVTVADNGNIYFAGQPDSSSFPKIIGLAPDGSVETDITLEEYAGIYYVDKITVYNDQIYYGVLGGNLTTPYPMMRRFNLDGSEDNTFQAPTLGSSYPYVYTLSINDDSIYAYSNSDGSSNSIKKFDIDGSLLVDELFSVSNGVAEYVHPRSFSDMENDEVITKRTIPNLDYVRNINPTVTGNILGSSEFAKSGNRLAFAQLFDIQDSLTTYTPQWSAITGNQSVVNLIGFTNGIPEGLKVEVVTRPQISTWTSITYANGLFVAISADGTNRVMTSPDGITWTMRTASAPNYWTSITYGNGLFVVVGATGTSRVMTSPDGITWTSRGSSVSQQWYAVTYGNGLYVAVASGHDSGSAAGRVRTSPDGITWTNRTASATNSWASITYGNGMFVAAGNSTIMSSSDGITWTTRYVDSNPNRLFSSVVYAQGKFVYIGRIGGGGTTGFQMSSTDGITWTDNPNFNFTGSWGDITYGDGLFVASSELGAIASSPDGIDWVLNQNDSSSYPNYWTSIAYGDEKYIRVGNIDTNIITKEPEKRFENIVNIYQYDGTPIVITDKVLNIESPTLQQVMTKGATSTISGATSITSNGGLFLDGGTGSTVVTGSDVAINAGNVEIGSNNGLTLSIGGVSTFVVEGDDLTPSVYTRTLANVTGREVISVNGLGADSTGNIVVPILPSITIISATTVALMVVGVEAYYGLTTSGTTASLPPIAGFSAKKFVVANKSGGNIEIFSNDGTSTDIWNAGTLTNTVTVPSGQIVELFNDGVSWMLKG